jgi:hypothetical protein
MHPDTMVSPVRVTEAQENAPHNGIASAQVSLENPPATVKISTNAAPRVSMQANSLSLPDQHAGQRITSSAHANEVPHVSPGQLSTSSQSNSHRAAYLGESGYMSMFSHEPVEDDATSQISSHGLQAQVLPLVLQESYFDTYVDYCYTWCPVLDREDMQRDLGFRDSELLRESIALVGSHLR